MQRNDLRTFARRSDRRVRQLAKIAINYQGKRKYYIRQAVFDLVAPLSCNVVADFGDVSYIVSTTDRGLSRVVYCQGSYEQDVMAYSFAVLGDLIGRRPLLEGRTFVDVGANIGTSTIPAVLLFGARNAVSFEPEPRNYKLLRCNILLNDLEDRVRPMRVALSDRNGMASMEWDFKNWGDHRLRTLTGLTDGTYSESSRPVFDVPISKFDDICQEAGIDLPSVGVVWMDVQGHEGHVLAGASTLVATDTPVVMEYWPYGLRRSGGLEALYTLVDQHYSTIVDVRAAMRTGKVTELRAGKLSDLEDVYSGETYTDIILLK